MDSQSNLPHICRTRASEGQMAREVTEVGMETASFSLPEILDMIKNGGEIRDSTAIAALGYWKLLGES